MNKRYIVIGASAAGIGTLSSLRKNDPTSDIIVLSAHTHLPYNTCLLADYVSDGEEPTALYTRNKTFFSQHNITFRPHSFVEHIDGAAQQLTLRTGEKFSFDAAFIGTGTTPITLPTEHQNLPNLFSFHTLDDAHALHTFIQKNKPKTALVIGAGLSGIECADALTERNINVTLIEGQNCLLPQLIDTTGSAFIEKKLAPTTTIFIPNTRVQHITSTPDKVTGVILENNLSLPADMVVCALGARPNLLLAHTANLTIADNGIATNRLLQTSEETLFSGGDVAAVHNTLTGTLTRSCTWPDAVMQGMTAGKNMAALHTHQPAKQKEYPGTTVVLSSTFYNTQFVSCGPVTDAATAQLTDTEVITHETPTYYYKFLVKNNTLIGFLLVGALQNIGTYRRLVTTKQQLTTAEKEQLTTLCV